MTEEQMRTLVKECGLDWHKGYMPLFDDDPTNRYAVLIEAAVLAERDECIKLMPILFANKHPHADADRMASPVQDVYFEALCKYRDAIRAKGMTTPNAK